MNRINSFLLVVAFTFGTLSLTAQDEFLKADKFYELYAFDLAISHYETALSTSNNLLAMAKLADAYRQVNELEKAATWYKKIYNNPAKSDIDVFLYAQTLKSLGKYSEAKKLFQEYEKVNPTIGSLYVASCNYAQRNMESPSQFELAEIPSANSKEADFAPAFVGDELIFSSFRKDDLKEQGNSEFNKANSHQFYLSSINSKGQVSAAQVLRKGIQTNINQAYATTSAATKTVAYVKTNSNFANGILPLAGSGAKMDIYLASITGEHVWEDAKQFTYNEAKSASGYPFLTADGKTLYFASNRAGGYGGFDLYVSTKIGAMWSEPKNLGSQINTPGNEISPRLDAETIYFASDWHMGFGGLDIFQAEKEMGEWSAVKNLGSGINSWADDYDFVYSKKYDLGFFASNRSGGKGKDDIYKVKKIHAPTDVQLALVDEESGEPIFGAIVDLSDCGHGIYKTNAEGIVTVPAAIGKDCSATLTKTGFKEAKSAIAINNSKLENITIKMSKTRSYYVGVIRNSETENGVENIMVKMTDENGIETKILTDEQGQYSLPLVPNSSYILSYSKAGYVNKSKTVKTGKLIDHNLLSVVELEPSPFKDNTAYVMKPADDRPELPIHLKKEGSSKGMIELPTDRRKYEEEAPSPAKVNKIAPVAPPTIQAEEGEMVYEIQIGAFSKPNLKLQRALADIGMVYTDKKGELLLYKVGTYGDKTKASKALGSVKERGYKDAFIRTVRTNNPIVRAIANMSDKERMEAMQAETAKVVKVEKPVAVEALAKQETAQSVVFRVQLGAFSSANKVDFSPELLKAGKLDKITNDKGITIYLLGDYDSLGQAQSAKTLAVEVGVTNAFVVAFKDGKKVPVGEVVE